MKDAFIEDDYLALCSVFTLKGLILNHIRSMFDNPKDYE